MSSHTPSYYAATAGAGARYPMLAGSAEADVVVVGGGFTGLSAALAAAEAGFSVALIEARRVGWGASGRNGGQMIPGMRWAANDLAGEFGDARARDLLRLAYRANDSVRDRIARHAIACDLADGHFAAASKPAHLATMAAERDTLARLIDYDGLELVGPAEVGRHVACDRYAGGLYDPKGGHLHPLKYALGLASAARQAGVRIFEDSPVEAMDHHGPVVARTAYGEVRARHGVIACDTEVAELEKRFAGAMMTVMNYNVATAPLGKARAAALIPSNASIAESRFVLNYYRLSADHRLIFGGGEKYSPTPPRDIAGFVRPYMEEVFPQIAGTPIDYAWGGAVGVTLNRLPQFGRIGQSFYAQGWSGHGVLLTTLAGELIAEAMRGQAERFDLFAALPAPRFPGGRWLRHPLYVAGMLYFAMRDRLG